MNVINFMDLSRQCKTLKNEIFEAMEEVYDDIAFVGGRFISKFEEEFAEYIGIKHASGVSNGTDALFLACKAIGVGPGDEVIVPSNTFIASAWAPLHCGARVRFADCSDKDWLISSESVEPLITDKTKAIIGVHLYGQPYDLGAMSNICKKYGLKLIEDCAQAHGAKWKDSTVGTVGDLGCFSFYPGKNLGAYGDAGAVVSNDDEIINTINLLKNHGSSTKYRHDVPGYNMRLDGLQAAVLSVKLRYLDSWNKRRTEIYEMYREGLSNDKIQLQNINPFSNGVHHIFPVLADNRQKFMSFMSERGVNCGIHYPIPCHLQPVFSGLGYKVGDLPNSEYVMEHCVSLPMYPELTDEEVDKIITDVNSYE